MSMINNTDIQRVMINLTQSCTNYVHDMSMIQLEKLAICLLRCKTEISAQDMLEGLEDISFKQLRRKYLERLLNMNVISMTIPDKPKSKKQKYIISQSGLNIIQTKA